jgi:membrane-bound lytic murein transglycosylase F
MFRAVMIALLTMSLLAVPEAEGLDGANRYDRYFAKYTERIFGPDFDWRYFKAQALAESTMRPDARSPKGALGIMQLMPCTFEEVVRENPWIEGDIHDPEWNIAAGICYNRALWKIWDGERPFEERLSFMFGAYNAGKGTILEAQEIALQQGLNARSWSVVEKTLPQVIGSGGGQIIAYVERVHRIRDRLGPTLARETHREGTPES